MLCCGFIFAPRHPRPMSAPVNEAEALFKEGTRLLAAGDVAGAEVHFARVLSLVPEQGAALANLAWLKEQAGSLEAAAALYRRAIAAMPDNAHIQRNFGMLLWGLKRFDEIGRASCRERV